jgi:hypothetical protein
MRTHVEFISTDFPTYPGEEEEINPGRYGKRLAEFIAAGLPQHGFKVDGLINEDWGWMISLENQAFPLWVGCGNYEEFENGFLCFIEPSKPYVRKWFSKIETQPTTDRLVNALDDILSSSNKISRLRWWAENEASL